MRKPLFCLLVLSLLVGCQTTSEVVDEPIGYLGFQDGQVWAIQFNDCGVVNYVEAKKYQWFDRSLESISCYQFTPQQTMPAVSVYESPNMDSQPIEQVLRFSELQVSESGWGTFPSVYQIQDNNWVRLKEGWIHLSVDDLKLVQFYPGEQNTQYKQAHDQYYLEH